MPRLDTATLSAWMIDFGQSVYDNEAALSELDRLIGDGDHGANLHRGTTAVMELKPDDFETPSALLNKVDMTLVSTVGGAAGPLYGTFFLRMGAALTSVGVDGEVSDADFAAAWRAGVTGVQTRGKAEAGDKTMVDALLPAAEAFEAGAAAGSAFVDSLAVAVQAAAAGRDATVPMLARKGRASYLGERSVGHMDPGAASSAMLVSSAGRTLR